MDRELVDFHHRIGGFEAMGKVFLDDLERKLGVPILWHTPELFSL
jgi:hypothetical protein